MSLWSWLKRLAKVAYALLAMYGILAGINADAGSFNEVVKVFFQQLKLDSILTRTWQMLLEHWPFFTILSIGLTGMVYLLVSKPRTKYKSEIDEARKRARMKGKKDKSK